MNTIGYCETNSFPGLYPVAHLISSVSSVQRNLFIHLCVHPVTLLLYRHSEHVNVFFCFCCLLQFVKTQFPVTWQQQSCVVIPSCLQYYPTVQHLLNICRNSEDMCVWLLPSCLSRQPPVEWVAGIVCLFTGKHLNHSFHAFPMCLCLCTHWLCAWYNTHHTLVHSSVLSSQRMSLFWESLFLHFSIGLRVLCWGRNIKNNHTISVVFGPFWKVCLKLERISSQ